MCTMITELAKAIIIIDVVHRVYLGDVVRCYVLDCIMCASFAELVRIRSCNKASEHSSSKTVEWVMSQTGNIQTAEPLVD